jgi:flagellar motor protein MotB
MTRPILDDEEQPARIPGWAMTYIDLLWLLLLFFILRSAVGEIGESRRYRDISAALKKRFGMEAMAVPAEQSTNKTEIAANGNDRTQYSEIVRQGLDEAAEKKKRSLASRGVIYFSEGEDQLQSEQKQILQAVAEQIGHASETIEICGVTVEKTVAAGKVDRAAVDPTYARCVAARDYLVKLGIEPRRLRIAIGGEKRRPGERPCVRLYGVAEIAEKPGKIPVKR